MHQTQTTMSSVVVAGNGSHYPDNEAIAVSMAADLLAAGSEGRGDEVIRILEVDSELLRVADFNKDTVLHLLVSGGYVKPLEQLLRFMIDKNPELLKEVARRENAQEYTPTCLAFKNGHNQIVNLLDKMWQEPFHTMNDGGGCWGWCWEYYNSLLNKEASSEEENEVLSPQNENKDSLQRVYEGLLEAWRKCNSYVVPSASFSDIAMEREFKAIVESAIFKVNIFEMLEVNTNLMRYKNSRGETILHKLAFSGDSEVLKKLVGHLVTTSRMTGPNDQCQLPTLSLLLEGDESGWTPLHHAIYFGNIKASRYLMEVAPEAIYQMDEDGGSPLYLAIILHYDELVKYALEIMPEASMSAATRSSLLTPNKNSLPHAAIGQKKLNMLEMLLKKIPSLIDSLNEKGWKPLSYAAYKYYYLDYVRYLLNNFPESVKKFDSDGSFPIHKAVSGGHICIIKEFISIHPQTLHFIDKQGRNILHVAVICGKTDILRYLKSEVKDIKKLYYLRDSNGKTFADYAPRNN